MAHSSDPAVHNALGIMESTRLSPEQKEAKISNILSRMDAASAAIFVNSLLVTAGTSKNGATLSTSLANTLIQVAKSNPTLQSSIGLGMGRATATMNTAGYTGSSTALNAAARNSGLASLMTAMNTGVQQGQNTTVFTFVISPSQVNSQN